MLTGVYKLNRRDRRTIEQFALRANTRQIFAYLADLGSRLEIDRPVAIGTNLGSTMHLSGCGPVVAFLRGMRFLDAQPDLQTLLNRTQVIRPRSKKSKESVKPRLAKSFHENLRASERKFCLLSCIPPCGDTIARAHSIQMATFKQFAPSGHLYAFERIDRDEGARNHVEKIGIREASTFYGFCNKHDDEIFGPLEKVSFTGTPEQIFLYHYRAFAEDLYQRLRTKQFLDPTLDEADKIVHRQNLDKLTDMQTANESDLKDFEPINADMIRRIKDKDYSGLECCLIKGLGTPGAIGTGFVLPWEDFQGERFLDRAFDVPSSWLSITMAIIDSRPAVLIIGNKDSLNLRRMVASFCALPKERRPIDLVRYFLGTFDNMFFLPQWWESLSGAQTLRARVCNSAKYFTDYFQADCPWSLETFRIIQT
jgi:hypothetical protein